MSESVWKPIRGPQTAFLASGVYEVLYGGAAGGGKSEALLMGALRDIDEPSYRALILRRTFKELERSLIERSRQWYGNASLRGEYNASTHQWRFPSGAVIEFGHLEHEADVHAYQSAEYTYIGFDELTLFTERQYVYMLSRARSSKGLKVRIRAATNPGGGGHEWVMRRWGPWLNHGTGYAGPRAQPGQTLYYRNTERGEEWCDRGERTFGRVFIPAKVSDNPYLAGSQYEDQLSGLDSVTRAQLRDGDWTVRPDGALWNQALIEPYRIRPEEFGGISLRRVVVAIDPSGSAKKSADEAGIVVAGIGPCKLCETDEMHGFVLEDLSGRFSPNDMGKRAIDAYHRNKADRLVAEINFGGQYVQDLIHLIDKTVSYKEVYASRGKIIRAEPIAALYERGLVHHVGIFPGLEHELYTYTPQEPTSPGRMDALVWALTDLMLDAPWMGTSANFDNPASDSYWDRPEAEKRRTHLLGFE